MRRILGHHDLFFEGNSSAIAEKNKEVMTQKTS
jgi:hypothetical protein